MIKATCLANVRCGRIQFLIRKKEPGYKEFARILTAIDKGNAMSWYGDVCDKDGKEQCGLILTTRPQIKTKRKDNDLWRSHKHSKALYGGNLLC